MLFSKPLAVGAVAPPFTCPDQEGQVVILNQLRGKYVVLVFYPADDTPGCTAQLCALRDGWKRLREAGCVAFGVNPAGEAKHKRFREKHEFPFPLLVDKSQRIAKLYRCQGLVVKRTVYVIGPDGRIVFSKRGAPGVDEILAAIGEGKDVS